MIDEIRQRLIAKINSPKATAPLKAALAYLEDRSIDEPRSRILAGLLLVGAELDNEGKPRLQHLNADEGFMVIAAFRYCLGRASYAPGIAMQEIRRLRHRLEPNDVALIAREIREYGRDQDRYRQTDIEAGREVMSQREADQWWYRAEWERLAEELEPE